MGNGYTVPPQDEWDELRLAIVRMQDRISELERPTGTQTYEALAELRQLVEDLPGQINAALAISVNTGAVNATGRGTFDGGLTSADVKSRTLSVGYDSVYIDVNHILGLSPSARRFKQNIKNASIDPAVIDGMRPRQFQLKGAIQALGDEAPFELGFVAEELEEIGLGDFVTRDADGRTTGIAYERLCVPLVAAVKDLRARVAALEA